MAEEKNEAQETSRMKNAVSEESIKASYEGVHNMYSGVYDTYLGVHEDYPGVGTNGEAAETEEPDPQ